MFDISISMVRQLLNYASTRGVDQGVLLKKMGLDPSILEDPDKRIPIEVFYDIQRESISSTGDPYFGLHQGAVSELGDHSIMGYIMANCRNLREALERACKYFDIIGVLLKIDFREEEEESKLVFLMNPNFSGSIRQCLEGALSGFSKLIRTITKLHITPKEVWIIHEPPEDISEYERVFQCPVMFNQGIPALVFNKEALDTPIVSPNPVLLSLLEHHASSFLDQINEQNLFSRKISTLLFERLQEGVPRVDMVAKELGMSIRSLQTKLKNEGMTFSQIVEYVRKELSKSYLAEKHYSIDDITYLLGFSDTSVFHRAFKRWTGKTPKQYRLNSKPSFNVD